LTEIKLASETRIVWASIAARKEWEPRIQLADEGYRCAERMTVACGARQAGQLWLSMPDYLTFLPWAMEHGLTVRFVRWTGMLSGFTHQGYPPGNDMAVVAFGRDLSLPYESLFGYPVCCQEFFAREFPLDADPVPAWAKSEGPGSPLCNPLLRYIGVRAVPHIPCGRACAATEKVGEEFLANMAPECAEATRAILGLPLTWDRYRGVAIVTARPFRVIATSTARLHHDTIVEAP
jgi:hypothetical protein